MSRLVAGILCLSCALLASCGGGSSSPDPTERPTPRPTATSALTVTPTPLSAAFRTVHFRTDFSLATYLPDGTQGGFSAVVEGDYAGPGRQRATVELLVDGESFPAEVITIDQMAWKRVGTVHFVPTDRNDPAVSLLLDLLPIDGLLQTRPVDLGFSTAPFPGEADEIEGTPAFRYDITDELGREVLEAGGEAAVEGFLGGGSLDDVEAFDMSIWITEDYSRMLKLYVKARFSPQYLGDVFREDAPEGTIIDYEASVTFSRYDDPTIVVAPPSAP